MNNEESNTKRYLEYNIKHMNTHVLTKQINHLLKTLNPQIKSTNLNDHFYQLIQKLITQAEFVEFDLQIKMRNICVELEKCISNSKVVLFFVDSVENNVTQFAAPSMHETILNFHHDINHSENKISASFDYKIRVSNISQDPHWEEYYHHFAKLRLTSNWTIPIYRTSHFFCAFAIFTEVYKYPIRKELNCIQEHKNNFNKLISEYPADFTSFWMKDVARIE